MIRIALAPMQYSKRSFWIGFRKLVWCHNVHFGFSNAEKPSLKAYAPCAHYDSDKDLGCERTKMSGKAGGQTLGNPP